MTEHRPLFERLTEICGRPILTAGDLGVMELEAILNGKPIEPPVDTWMAPYTDEMQNSLVATGALWAMFGKLLDNELYVDSLDHNALVIAFRKHTFAGKAYRLTVEQVRPLNPDDEPF